MTATAEYTIDELTKLTRRRRELAQGVADLREDFAAQQAAVRQQAQALADLGNHQAEATAESARNRLKGVGLALTEAERALKQFCAAHPTQGELEALLAAKQRQEEAAARSAAKAKFVAKHQELELLLAAVEEKSAELEALRLAAPAGSFRMPLMVQELCAPLRHWNDYRTAPNGSPLTAIRQSLSQI